MSFKEGGLLSRKTDRACAAAVALLVLFESTLPSQAEYSFLNNFEVAASQLVSDLQSNSLHTDNVSQLAQDYLIGPLSNPNMSRYYQSLGPLQSICPTTIVGYPNGKEFSFRSVHSLGSTDWIVTVSQDPETIESVVNFGSGKGAPAILPILPNGATPQPPTQVGCISPTKMNATNQQLEEACRRWPKMC